MGRISTKEILNDLEGVSPSNDLTTKEVLALPNSLRRFIRWVLQERSVTCEQVAAFLGETEKDARSLVRELAVRGLIEHVPTCGVPVYRVCLEPRRLRIPEELLKDLEVG